MIDFIRIRYEDKSVIEPFVCNKENFETLDAIVEYHSGEIKYPFTTKIGVMEVRVTQKSVFVKNSLHKLFNLLGEDGNHNANDFTYSSLCQMIDYLVAHLPQLDSAKITQLEFGLNVNTDISAEEIIRNNVLMHNLKAHSHNKKFYGKGEYKQFDHYNYELKIYDKAKQYRLNQNILRFEVRFSRSRDFNRIGVHSISDLKSKECLGSLFDILMKRYNELLIVDRLDSEELTEEISNEISRYLCSFFWQDLKDRKHRNVKAKLKKRFFGLLEDYNLLKTKNQIRTLLTDKFNQLINS